MKLSISTLLLAAGAADAAITLSVGDKASISQAAGAVAKNMVEYYHGEEYGRIPGLLDGPPFFATGAYWWQSGAMFGSLLDYRYYTGDKQYDSIITDALIHQSSGTRDFMPQNQTKSLGNDDQAFWAISAMQAAETKFPDPPPDAKASWLAMVQAVFNLQAHRWDNATCNGGLRWQIYWFNNGYDYKNSISEGCFANIAARLGAYTRNQTYLDWVDKTWDWSYNVGLVSTDYNVYDGTSAEKNCSDQNHIEWTYNNAIFTHTAAVMYNVTNGTTQAMWKARLDGLLATGIQLFYENNIMKEQACEDVNGSGNCNTDQLSFKAYMSRWWAATIKLAPYTRNIIKPYLEASATAAAKTCTAGTDGNACGMNWRTGVNDGKIGVGQQMSALEVIQSNLIDYVNGPVSNATGGTSIGDPAAGSGTSDNIIFYAPITTGDKAGAGILTAILLICTVAGGWWIVT